MCAAETMAERHSRMLSRLAELSLGLAEAVQGQALAAETPDEQARLTHAFGRAAHSLRQSVALEAKLAQDAVREQRTQHIDHEARRDQERTRRGSQLRLTLGRLVVEHVRGFERETQLRELDRLVTEGQLFEAFVDAPFDEQIAILADHLALDPALAAEMSPFCPDPPDNDDDGEAESGQPPLRDTG